MHRLDFMNASWTGDVYHCPLCKRDYKTSNTFLRHLKMKTHKIQEKEKSADL